MQKEQGDDVKIKREYRLILSLTVLGIVLVC